MNMENENYEGYVVADITAGRSAFPIPNAGIVITKPTEEGEILESFLKTDRNGKAGPVTLEAPDPSYSKDPYGPKPYSTYYAKIRHPNFYDADGYMIDVFPNEISRIEKDLIPLPSLK